MEDDSAMVKDENKLGESESNELTTPKTPLKKQLQTKKKFAKGNRKSVAFNNLLALTEASKKENTESDTSDPFASSAINVEVLLPPKREQRNYDELLIEDIENNGRFATSNVEDIPTGATSDSSIANFAVENSTVVPSVPTEQNTTNSIRDESLFPPRIQKSREDLSSSSSSSLITMDASESMSMTLNTKLFELVMNLAQVQSKTEAQMGFVSDKMSREEKTTELLLKCFLQTQQSMEEMKTFVRDSSREALGNHSKRKNVREWDSEDEEDERATEEQREEKKKKLIFYETELKETQQKLLKSETENSDLRRVLEKTKRKLKQQDSQLADLNANYSQALSSSKTYWESQLLEREKAILKWKQQYDALIDENRKLETICARNARQLREGQMLENANRTLTSMNSGKLMRIGGEGGTGGNGESVLLNTAGGSLTTVETLRRANKVNGTLNDSFFECFTGKKESDNGSNAK